MFAGGRSMGALAVPGSVITTVGLILFFQNLFGLWATWAYAWTLIIAGAGVGLVIFGNWSEQPDLRRAGRVVIGAGLVFFFIFGLFFELGASLLGQRSLGGIFWPLALILLGVYVLFGRVLFNQVSGPVSRSTLNFTASGEAANADTQGTSGAQGTMGAQITSGPVTGIRRVSFHTLGDMTILQGEREELEIEASQAVKERIRAEVRGDTLEIRYEQDWLDWINPRFWNISPIHYTLYVRDLERIDAAGLGNLLIPALAAQRLNLVHSGTGNVTIRSLAVEDLSINQAGLGNIDITGRAHRQDVELTGTGSYQAGRLECQVATVRLSGLGSATVNVNETLDARVSGTGSIHFYGSPRVSQHVSGLGSVQHLN
jgi:hypothetical protein